MWTKLTPLLRAQGHEVFAPTLTGLSDRSHLSHCGIDLSTHITDVTNFIVYEDLSDVILVGNSYGGMVISGVASIDSKRLKTLVYLDAYVPESGQSEIDLWPPERKAWAKEVESGGIDQPPPFNIFGVIDPELLDWIEERVSPHPMNTYMESVPQGSAESEAIPRVFIHFIGWPSTTPNIFDPFAAKAKEKGWNVHEIVAGHLAMLTAPQELSDLLIKISKAA